MPSEIIHMSEDRRINAPRLSPAKEVVMNKMKKNENETTSEI